ncbi:MAG: hypothetical protein ACTSYA_04100 [Candidatus Kariarchaeaceae archaeon]
MSLDDWLALSEEHQMQLFDILNSFVTRSSVLINKTEALQQDLGITYSRIICLEIINSNEPPVKFSFSEIVELFSNLISFINESIIGSYTKDRIIEDLLAESKISKERITSLLDKIFDAPFFPILVFRLSRDPNTISDVTVHRNEFVINIPENIIINFPVYDVLLTLKNGSNIVLKIDRDELKNLSKAIDKGLKIE